MIDKNKKRFYQVHVDQLAYFYLKQKCNTLRTESTYALCLNLFRCNRESFKLGGSFIRVVMSEVLSKTFLIYSQRTLKTTHCTFSTSADRLSVPSNSSDARMGRTDTFLFQQLFVYLALTSTKICYKCYLTN